MNLKVYLANNDMTMRDFCSRINYDPRYLSLIMNGHKIPGRKLAEQIENLTNGQVTFSRKNTETIE
jgi:transcriptional regulator with XRE-family HTH domain